MPGAQMVRSEPTVVVSWKRRAQQLRKEAHVFYFVFKHPHTPWYAKLIAICIAAYMFSPVQLIPNFIPVIGMMDDVLLLFLGVKLLRKITPADVFTECRKLADAAESRRKEEIRSASASIASVAITAAWLIAGIAFSVLIAIYFHH